MEIHGILWPPGNGKKKGSLGATKKLCGGLSEIVGDFKRLWTYWRKKGIANRARGQMEDFQRALEDSSSHDLGFKGPKYTWNNGQHGRGYTQERLDRAVANLEWSALWTAAEVEVLACHTGLKHSGQNVWISLRLFLNPRNRDSKVGICD